MEKTKDKKRERLSAVARAALAAALALMVCLPAGPSTASADDAEANDAIVHIHSYKIENGDDDMNGGTGYLTSDGTVSYCYDATTHGEALTPESSVREPVPATA